MDNGQNIKGSQRRRLRSPPLRDIVVFPHMIVPLFVGREKSIKALEEVMGQEKQILLATQMNAADDDPEPDAIFDIGTLANVLQLLKLPDGTVKVLVEGASRAKIVSFTDRPDFHRPVLRRWSSRKRKRSRSRRWPARSSPTSRITSS
ncbi:hypothetical protein AJ88_06315 [Mesorhizobium amorphae CCBAU 01583]|nr:hypothetical protein AJ88_06315 [Mesorhizobium amorphae CCBAU 01583]